MSDSVPPPRPFVQMILIDEATPTATSNTSTSIAARATAAAVLVNTWTLAVSQRAREAGCDVVAVPSHPPVLKRKNRSSVWSYFTKTEDEKYVVCKCDDECHWRVAYVDSSTTNMRNHLLNEHKPVVLNLLTFSSISLSMTR
jgi:hypothetical protein